MKNNAELDPDKKSKKSIEIISEIPSFFSYKLKKIYLFILQSNVRINSYQKKYLTLITQSSKDWESIKTQHKISKSLYKSPYIKIILFFIKYNNGIINKQTIIFISLIDLIIYFNAPLTVIKKVDNSIDVDESELDNTETYELNKFNNLISKRSNSKFIKENSMIEEKKQIKNYEYSKKYNEDVNVYIQKKLDMLFQNKFPKEYKSFNEILNNSSYINAMMCINLINEKWISFLQLVISCMITAIYMSLNGIKNKMKIIDNISLLLSYLVPYILISSGVKIYDYKIERYNKDKYYLIKSNLLINQIRKYKILNLLPSYNKKILKLINEYYFENKDDIVFFIKEVLKNV